jgi:hypothetical protein
MPLEQNPDGTLQTAGWIGRGSVKMARQTASEPQPLLPAGRGVGWRRDAQVFALIEDDGLNHVACAVGGEVPRVVRDVLNLASSQVQGQVTNFGRRTATESS